MMDIQFALDFLKELAQHNHKDWMDANKKRYLQAKENVIELVAEILNEVSKFDPGVSNLEPKKTLFRINRDIRFSKNKDPYKTNFGAFLVEGVRTPETLATIYTLSRAIAFGEEVSTSLLAKCLVK